MESELQDKRPDDGSDSIRDAALALFAPHRRRFVWASALGVATLAGQVLLLVVFWNVVREVADGAGALEALSSKETGGLLALLVVLLALLRWRAPLAQMQAEQGFVEDLQTRMLEGMLHRAPSFWAKAEHGELTHRLSEDVTGTLAYVRALVQTRWLVPLRAVAFAALLAWIAPDVLLPAALALPLFALVLVIVGKGVSEVAVRERASRIAHSSRLAQLLSGAEILSAFDSRRRAVDALARRLRAGYAQALSSSRYSAFGTQAAEFIRIAGVLAVLLFSAEDMDPATMLGAIPLLFLLYSPVAELARLLPQLAHGRIATQSVLEFLGEERERESSPGGFSKLEVRALEFAYDASHKILTGVDLTLDAGECLAITGESGVGKSTLLKLLLGAEDPGMGEILRDGKPGSLRGLCALVTQEPIFPERTVRENLLLARPEASDEELWHALSRAGLADRIRREDSQLDLDIGEGGKAFSGGERERLSLARALLSGAPVLALDEPGVFLDAAHRARILETLREECGTRTLLIVTHEEDLLTLADHKVRLEAGKLHPLGGSGS